MFNVYYDPIRWDPWQFTKFRLFIVENCILFGFLVYLKKLMHTLAEHTRKDFIPCWAYAEQISLPVEHTQNKFLLMLSQRLNFDNFDMDIQTHAQ
jgi:hypothetical protein